MNKMKFRLSDSVFYRKYGNITVLYDTDRKKYSCSMPSHMKS